MKKCTYDPKLNYNTPICDSIMKELGWAKYGKVPVFYKPNHDGANPKYKWFISFPTEYIGYYGVYEDWFNEGKIDREGIKKMLAHFDNACANTWAVDLDWTLPLLAADFYYHNLDWKRHYKAVAKFEKLTGKKYK